MLRRITLMIDLQTPEGTIPAGTQHEVDDQMYDWLMECYAFHRKIDAEKIRQLDLMFPKDKQ